MQWTEEQDIQLTALWLEGKSASEIGKIVGRTRNSVIGRVHRKGLPKREGSTTRLPRQDAAGGGARALTRTPKVSKDPPPPKPEAPIVKPKKPAPWKGKPLPLMRLTLRTCRWPVKGEGAAMFYCGAPRYNDPGRGVRPYCKEHCVKAYVYR